MPNVEVVLIVVCGYLGTRAVTCNGWLGLFSTGSDGPVIWIACVARRLKQIGEGPRPVRWHASLVILSRGRISRCLSSWKSCIIIAFTHLIWEKSILYIKLEESVRLTYSNPNVEGPRSLVAHTRIQKTMAQIKLHNSEENEISQISPAPTWEISMIFLVRG